MSTTTKFTLACAFGLASSLPNAAAPQLEQKLAAQWERYHRAQQTLIDQVGCEGKPLTRETWEKLLAVSPENELNDSEQIELVNRHRRTVAANRAQAAILSRKLGVDLGVIRERDEVAKFCAELPKGGMLHVHPSGTIKPESARKVLVAIDPLIQRDALIAKVKVPGSLFPAARLEQLSQLPEKALFSTLPPETREMLVSMFVMLPTPYQQNFSQFQAEFSFASALFDMATKKLDVAGLYLKDFIARAERQRVRYVEFTKSCPADLPGLEKFSKSRDDLVGKGPVIINNNCAFTRTNDAAKIGADAKQTFEALLKAQQSGGPLANIVGIDLISNEREDEANGRDVSALGAGQRIYACRLKLIKEQHLKLRATMHAGELGDVRNVRDAMIMGAERLGHAVRLLDDPVVLEYARRHHVPIETNLVSSVRLRSVTSFEDHPFLTFLRLGLPVGLSTDDEGILDTDINNECVQAVSKTDITYAELRRLVRNSIITSFAPAPTKLSLLATLGKELSAFEARWRTATLAKRKQ